MRRTLPGGILIIIIVILIAWPSQEGIEHPKPTYVGAKKCQVCHIETYNAWKTTKHARALEALGSEKANSPGCLRCHTTGFADGGYGTEPTVVDLAGVQCEACHGAGSLFSRSSVMRQPKLSRELGLMPVDSTTCIRCHNEESPTFKGFAYRAGLSTGTHLPDSDSGSMIP